MDDDNSNTEVTNNSNQENNPSTTSSEQTAYELLLKQQQMFLQWQLENELEKVRLYLFYMVLFYHLFFKSGQSYWIFIDFFTFCISVPQDSSKVKTDFNHHFHNWNTTKSWTEATEQTHFEIYSTATVSAW